MMIESTNELALFLTSNQSQLTFSNDELRTKSATCCGWLQHEEGSPIYKIIEGGVYEVEFNANVTSLTAGVVALAYVGSGVLFGALGSVLSMRKHLNV